MTIAQRESRRRDAAVVDTVDLLTAIADVGDPFAAHLLAAARIGIIKETATAAEAHLVELERSPTTQLPSFAMLRKLHP